MQKNTVISIVLVIILIGGIGYGYSAYKKNNEAKMELASYDEARALLNGKIDPSGSAAITLVLNTQNQLIKLPKETTIIQALKENTTKCKAKARENSGYVTEFMKLTQRFSGLNGQYISQFAEKERTMNVKLTKLCSTQELAIGELEIVNSKAATYGEASLLKSDWNDLFKSLEEVKTGLDEMTTIRKELEDIWAKIQKRS